MSFTTKEPLEEIISVLRRCLPGLQQMLWNHGDVSTLHPTVEMLSSLIARYDRGEIVEKKNGPGSDAPKGRRTLAKTARKAR